MNHYPLIGRKVPRGCDDATGTANPFAHIDCPKCRSFLASKVALDSAEAARTKNRQHAGLLAGTSKHFAGILAA